MILVSTVKQSLPENKLHMIMSNHLSRENNLVSRFWDLLRVSTEVKKKK